jgi:DNA-binding response OmpR family regulator
MNVLIAEDDLMILKTLEFRLKKDGYSTTVVENGQTAIDYLKANTPDLVITDLMMPFVSGMELLYYMKQNLPDIPVIILSAAGQEHTVTEAFTLGADDFITKPFSPSELSLRVKRLLGQ